MNYLLIIAVIIAVLIIILFFKLIKNVAKSLLYSLIILVMLSGVFGFVLARDMRDFSRGMSENTAIFLLKENDTIVTGFTIENLNVSTAESLEKLIIEKYHSYYEEIEYSKILGTNYKLFIIDIKAYPETQNFDLLYVKEVFKGEQNIADLIEEAEDIPNNPAKTFLLLVLNNMRKDPLYLMKEFKNSNLVIYPESFMFKVLQYTIKEK